MKRATELGYASNLYSDVLIRCLKSRFQNLIGLAYIDFLDFNFAIKILFVFQSYLILGNNFQSFLMSCLVQHKHKSCFQIFTFGFLNITTPPCSHLSPANEPLETVGSLARVCM